MGFGEICAMGCSKADASGVYELATMPAGPDEWKMVVCVVRRRSKIFD